MVSNMVWNKDENDGFVEIESCDPYTVTDDFCPDMREMVYLRPVGTAIYVRGTFPPTFCSVFRPPTCSTTAAASTTTTGVAREPTDAP